MGKALSGIPRAVRGSGLKPLWTAGDLDGGLDENRRQKTCQNQPDNCRNTYDIIHRFPGSRIQNALGCLNCSHFDNSS